MAQVITLWSDKGGTGKSSLAANIAEAWGAVLVDIDPQEDGHRYATRRGIEAKMAATEADLLALLQGPGRVVVDCAPGQGPLEQRAIIHSDLLVIPCRTGEADLHALGRALALVRAVRQHRPELAVGGVLNNVRETGRTKGVEAALKLQAGSDYEWLGRMSARVGVEDAFADGKPLLACGGAVAYEFRQVFSRIEELLETATAGAGAQAIQ